MNRIYRTYGIYCITNTVTEKRYIGKTSNSFGDRWDCHRAQLNGGYHDNVALQSDWATYGAEAFEFSVIEESDDKSVLNDLEREYIRKFRERGELYNILDGGTGKTEGRHMSEHAKKIIGDKNRAHMTGRKASEETKKKMSEAQKRRYENWTEEDRSAHAKKVSDSSRGRHWSEESRAAFSEKQRTAPNGAVLDVAIVKEIRRMHEEENMTYGQIALALTIPYSTVYGIASYKRWKNI